MVSTVCCINVVSIPQKASYLWSSST
uniref:Uncharacterized protein n=1 Tax=Timema monikensis TaxID=170555 RepID=A0A7R9EJ07_9NEOP|nr:unnamed protein product [Timema monikensis]